MNNPHLPNSAMCFVMAGLQRLVALLVAFLQLSNAYSRVHLPNPSTSPSCIMLQLLTRASDCNFWQSKFDDVKVLHCHLPEVLQGLHNLTHVFVILNSNTSNSYGDVYRAMLFGEETYTLGVSYCAHAAYIPVTLAANTAYQVEVLRLYTNFTYHEPRVMDKDNLLLSVDTQGPSRNLAGQRKCTANPQLHDTHEQCGFCDMRSAGRTLPGRWLFSNRTLLQATCIPDLQDEDTQSFKEKYRPEQCGAAAERFSREVNTDELRFQPFGCKLPDPRQVNLGQCLRGRSVCFIGDSHMRYLNNMIVNYFQGLVPNDKDYQEWHTAQSNQYTRFKSTPWGNFLFDGEDQTPKDEGFQEATHVWLSTLSDCTDVVLSTGHWHLSFFAQRKQGKPFTAQQMLEVYGRARRFADALRAQGKAVYWANVMAHTIRHARFRHPYFNDNSLQFASFHSLPYQTLYNALAAELMAGYPVLDQFTIAESVSEFSVEGVHFIGSVGHAIASVMVNMLCGHLGLQAGTAQILLTDNSTHSDSPGAPRDRLGDNGASQS